MFKVDIVEFDENWFPFRFNPSKDFYEEERKWEKDDEEGISDTWMDEDEEEHKEGEIPQDDTITFGKINENEKTHQ